MIPKFLNNLELHKKKTMFEPILDITKILIPPKVDGVAG